MGIEEAIKLLREHHEEPPKPMCLPTEDEVRQAEIDLEFVFPDQFRQFHLAASNVVVGILEPGVVFIDVLPYINLRSIAQNGWGLGVPREQLPFCEDNGNYFCITHDGRVTYWDHDGASEYGSTSSFAEWIMNIWIGEYTF